jgi:hypothetical protein
MLTHDRERISLTKHRYFSIAAIILAAALVLQVSGLHARQDPAALQLPPGIDIKITAQPLQATVGDRIQIDYEISFPKGFQFQFPSLPEQLSEFTVLETFPGPAIPGRNAPEKQEGQHHQARLVVAVYRTGTFEFPALPFMLRDAEGKQMEVPGPTVKIRIDSVLSGENPDLKDLKKQAEIEAAVNWLLWFGILAVAAILAILVWRRLRRRPLPFLRPSAQPDVDPLDLADTELHELLGLGLLDKGMIKQFYVRLSEIVKKALEAGCGIQTVEKTTSEIMAALSAESEGRNARLDAENLELVETLLLSCDMVKFARYLPSRPESDEAISKTARILAACRAARSAVNPAAVPVEGVA